ncbi:hypothetical protein NDU88_010833 [Pleurodeles waltl]|uniref:Uncharacterized protein n=1 Tax=Pleurodeles waltl TaxID=8319 RepID=A0AAV7PX75_PLEWA|nr:hypothetical protein NDU88_010833 [Pleurodeles waltl]
MHDALETGSELDAALRMRPPELDLVLPMRGHERFEGDTPALSVGKQFFTAALSADQLSGEWERAIAFSRTAAF